MQLLLVATVIVACSARFPIMIYGTDLSRSDLFITEEQLIDRLHVVTANQGSKIHLFNIQTYYEEGDLFVAKLRSKTENLRVFQVSNTIFMNRAYSRTHSSVLT